MMLTLVSLRLAMHHQTLIASHFGDYHAILITCVIILTFFCCGYAHAYEIFWRPGGRLDDPLAGSLPRAEFCAAGFVGVNPPHHWKAKKSLSDMDACAMCLTLRHTANPFSLSVASLDEDLASQCLCFRFKTFYNELNHLLREYRRVAAVALCGLKPRHILAWKGDRLG